MPDVVDRIEHDHREHEHAEARQLIGLEELGERFEEAKDTTGKNHKGEHS